MFITKCAWCGVVMKCDPNGRDAISHGICPACYEEAVREMEEVTDDEWSEYEGQFGRDIEGAHQEAIEMANAPSAEQGPMGEDQPEWERVGLPHGEGIT